MLTREENELLTRVGPGTPGGELLRRYWQPVCYTQDFTSQKPILRVKMLGENLVAYRMPDGTYGLLAEKCTHRGASLAYGFVEDRGLRCAYHGWKFDPSGTCLEQPFEPEGSNYKERVQQRAYRVEALSGILFAYMGPPERKPLLPRWDVLVRTDGKRVLQRHPVLDCNWLQAQENSVDTVHTYFLHGHMMKMKGIKAGEYYLRPIKKYEFELNEWGIVKKRTWGGDKPEEELGHPAVFPNILRVPEGPRQAMHWRVPIDDESTRIFWAAIIPNGTGEPEPQPDEPQLDELPPLRHGPARDGEYTMDSFPSQDKMAWETQGAIYDRSEEHLGASDRGVTMLRRLLREQIEIVQKGGDPMALVWDPAQNEVIEFRTSTGQASKEYVESRAEYYGLDLGRKVQA